MMKNAIMLCSGGLDSVVTAHYVKKKLKYDNVIILFFDYGQRNIKWERKAAKKCAEDLSGEFKEIGLRELGAMSDSLINSSENVKKIERKDLKDTKKESEKYYVPCRNIVFLVYALSLAESLFISEKEIYDIFVGFKCEGGEAYPDTTKEFVDEMNELAKIGSGFKGEIIAPLIEKDKEEIVLLGGGLGVDLKNTYSCYIGSEDGKHCGGCLACMLRKEGFYWANMGDETEYQT